MPEVSTKELLFSVSAKDCEFIPTKGTGKGGQHRNKKMTAMHCRHTASGAMGHAEDSRSQEDNKKNAFLRMLETPTFKKWHSLEIARRMGKLTEIENSVEQEMKPKNLKIETRENGKWIQNDEDFKTAE